LASAQFNGDDGSNNDDMINVGLSYDQDDLHVAATYLSQDAPLSSIPTSVGNTSETIALAFANNFDNGLYLAGAWQQRELDLFGGEDTTQTTIDISLAYQVSINNKVKIGYFDLDDDTVGLSNISYNGYNLTIEHKMSDDFQVHAEILNKSFDTAKDDTAVSIGFKYNFSMNW
jgi:predicted porin